MAKKMLIETKKKKKSKINVFMINILEKYKNVFYIF